MSYGTLNHEQARFFRDQGYYKLLGVFDNHQTKALRTFIHEEVGKPNEVIVQKERSEKLYGLYDRDPALIRRAIGNQALVGALVSLLGPNVVFVKNRHNHATINGRRNTPIEGLHRDVLQPSRGLITALIYLQEATVENGATRIVPGSHNFPYVGVPQAAGGGTWMADHAEYAGLMDQVVPVPASEGDVLLFNGTLFHGIGHNKSERTRMSIALGFRSVDELDAQPDESRQVLVAGEYIYRGND